MDVISFKDVVITGVQISRVTVTKRMLNTALDLSNFRGYFVKILCVPCVNVKYNADETVS